MTIVAVALLVASVTSPLDAYRACVEPSPTAIMRAACADRVPPAGFWVHALAAFAADARLGSFHLEAFPRAWSEDDSWFGPSMLALVGKDSMTDALLRHHGLAWGDDATIAFEASFGFSAVHEFPGLTEAVLHTDVRRRWHATASAIRALGAGASATDVSRELRTTIIISDTLPAVATLYRAIWPVWIHYANYTGSVTRNHQMEYPADGCATVVCVRGAVE